MSTPPPTRKGHHPKPVIKDRRAAAAAQGAPGSLRRLKGLLGRPLALERRDGHLHMVLVDRRRAPEKSQPPPLVELRADLRSHLLAHDSAKEAKVMRHLVFVHEELGRTGWAGVGALPGELLARALVQAEMLASEETSPSLTAVIEQLRRLQVAADRRDCRDSRLSDSVMGGDLEVSEATHEEYEEMERSWVGSLPPGLVLDDRDK